MAGTVIMLVLGWTWKGVYVDTLRIEKAQLAAELKALEGQQKHLKNQLTALRSFPRIDWLAREQLHMQYASQAPRILPVPGLCMEKDAATIPRDDKLVASIDP
jgi:cell division protein FtsL